MPCAGLVEFLVLGPLDVRIDGRSIPLGGAKQRAIMALLLLRANEVVPIDRIVDEVWGDEPPRSARHTIEGYVSRLRRAIEPDGPAIAREGDGYRLDLDGAGLDAEAARELLRSADAASISGDGENAAALAREALRLWRGGALRDAPLHGAARAEAEELDELRLRVIERLAEAELALGRNDDVVALIRPLVDEHPYRERFVAQLMLALYRSGRPAAALDLYERTRLTLDRELGLRPSAELQRLSGDIVRHDARLASLVEAEAAAPSDAYPAAPRRLTPGRAAAVAAVVVLAAGAVIAALTLTRGEAAPPSVLASSLVRLDPQTLDVTKVIPVGPRADFVVTAGGYLWVTHGIIRHTNNGEGLRNAGDRTLTRVDPETGNESVVGQLAPCGMTADPSGDVWVANCYASAPANVVRVRARTLEFGPWCAASTGSGYYRGMAYGGGSLWVTDANETRRLTELDPRTCARHPIHFDRPPGPLAWSEGYGDLWMDDFNGGSTSRMDAGTRTVTKTYRSVANYPGVLVVQGDGVWVGDWDIAQVVRLPAVGSGTPRHLHLHVRTHPAGVTGIAAGAGSIWATLPEDHALFRINPRTGSQKRIPFRYTPWEVTVADDGVWVTMRPRG